MDLPGDRISSLSLKRVEEDLGKNKNKNKTLRNM